MVYELTEFQIHVVLRMASMLKIHQRSFGDQQLYIMVASQETSIHQPKLVSYNLGKEVSMQGRALPMESRYLGHLLVIPAVRTASVSPEKALAWV